MNDFKMHADMSVPELKRAKQDNKLHIATIKVAMRGSALKDRMEFEQAIAECRSNIDSIEARIARLERRERNAI